MLRGGISRDVTSKFPLIPPSPMESRGQEHSPDPVKTDNNAFSASSNAFRTRRRSTIPTYEEGNLDFHDVQEGLLGALA